MSKQSAMIWKWALTGPVLACLLLCGARRDQGQGRRPAPPPLIRFHQYRLPNGLRVLLAPDRAASTVGLCVTYAVGSRDETPGQAGWAHLMEHMMFQGSAHVGRGEHRQLVEQTGGEFQALTGQDHTEYYEELPAGQRALGLFLEADRMAALDLTQDNLDNQRAVVLREKMQRHSHQSYDVAQTALLDLAYGRFGYKHPAIGEKADLDAVTVADLRAFDRRFYAPGNAVLALTGDFDEPTARAEIARDFGVIPARAAPPPGSFAEPGAPGERRRALDDRFSRLQRCVVGYRVPPADSPDFPALDCLGDILGRGRTSRLFRTLVDPRRAVVTNCYTQGRRGPGLFVVTADLPPESSFQTAEGRIEAEIARIQSGGVTAMELQKARNRERMDLWGGLGATAGRARWLADEAVDCGDAGRVNTFLSRLDAVSPADVRRVARRYLSRANRIVLDVTPTTY